MADLALDTFVKRIGDRSASVAVIGLGYVGLPIVLALHDAGLKVIGFDIDAEYVEAARNRLKDTIAMLKEETSEMREAA